MANNNELEIKSGKDFLKITDPIGTTLLGFRTEGGVLTDVQVDWENVARIFGVTRELIDSNDLAPTARLILQSTVNNMTDGGVNKFLSAEQGKILNERFQRIIKKSDTIVETITGTSNGYYNADGTIADNWLYRNARYNIVADTPLFVVGKSDGGAMYVARYFDADNNEIGNQYQGAGGTTADVNGLLIIPSGTTWIGLSSRDVHPPVLYAGTVDFVTSEFFDNKTIEINESISLVSGNTEEIKEAVFGSEEAGKLLHEFVPGDFQGYYVATSPTKSRNVSDTYRCIEILVSDLVNKKLFYTGNTEMNNSIAKQAVFYDRNGNNIGVYNDDSVQFHDMDLIPIPDGCYSIGVSIFLTASYQYGRVKTDALINNIEKNSQDIQDIKQEIGIIGGLKIVWFGTSIPTGDKASVEINGYVGENNYPKMVEYLLKATVYNEAIGGTRISTGNPDSVDALGATGEHCFQFISALMHTLAEKQEIIDNWDSFYSTVLTNITGSDINRVTSGQILEDSYENKLIKKYLTANATVGRADIYIIDHGFNDKFKIKDHPEMPAPYSSKEAMYYWGAVSQLIRTILSDNPFAKIIMVSHYQKSATWQMPDLYTPMKNVADYWGIPFIDLVHNLNLDGNKIYTQSYYDANGIYHDSGVEFTLDPINETFTTNNIGSFIRNESYSVLISEYDPRIVEANTELSKVFPVGSWVYRMPKSFIFCPDSVHPHSCKSGESNWLIANYIAKTIRSL